MRAGDLVKKLKLDSEFVWKSKVIQIEGEEAFRRIEKKADDLFLMFKELLTGSKIPTCKQIKRMIPDGFEGHFVREDYIHRYGFAIPCREAIEAIRKYSPILEVGAGTGYWAALLDCDIIATDIGRASPELIKQKKWFKPGSHFPVKKMSAEKAMKKWPDRNLFFCWPSYDEPWPTEALKNLKFGKYVIYIGESEGGCTADDAFHQELRDKFEEVEDIPIPQWRGMHDNLWVYKKVKR